MKYKTPFKKMQSEIGSWVSFLGKPFTFFILFITITSAIHNATGWTLLPIYETTLSGYRLFTHYLFDTLFYSWFVFILKAAFYGIMVVLEPLTRLSPYLPDIVLPVWVRDSALISAILYRAQEQSMMVAMPSTTLEMSEEERKNWRLNLRQKSFIFSIILQILWAIVLFLYFIGRCFRYPFRFIKVKWFQDSLKLFLGGVLMLGIAFFLHDLLLTYLIRDFNDERTLNQRKFMIWLIVSIVSATLASMVFLATNGFFIVHP
jgi:hypothetical protein